MKIGGDIRNAYNEFYKTHDKEWRLLGAKYKAHHITNVCKGQVFNKILEVGAGDGSLLQKLSDYGFGAEYHAVEISDAAAALINKRNIKNLASVQVIDGYHLPFDDDSFDLVILSHVLEYVDHPQLLLQEIKRVSKNFVIEVAVNLKPGKQQTSGLINTYTPGSIRLLLEKQGFEIRKDLSSINGPEVIRYNTFINHKRPRNFVNRFKILSVFAIKNTMVELSDTLRERLANAYTVLCTKTNTPYSKIANS